MGNEGMQHFLNMLTGFLGENDWVAQVFIVVFVALLIDFVQRRILNRLHVKLVKTENFWDDSVVDSLKQRLLRWMLGFFLKIFEAIQNWGI